ncbi:MAG: prolyl-tRNA synthetase associated domain-containing protein [Clostridia bacterium]|nr:prolyl-tRNA synthetase associated domain-containing protein [Clostridia bacterium]
MILEKGRPADISDRLEKEIAVYLFLEKLGVDFLRVDHQPAMTMEICAEIDKVLGAAICKNLFLCNRQQTDFYLLMMPDDKPFKTKNLSQQIGSARLSFAGAEHMEALLNITPGSVSVMGLMNDTENRVTLLIDEDVLKDDFFGCHPCINTSSLKIKTDDLLNKIIPALGNKFSTVRLAAE